MSAYLQAPQTGDISPSEDMSKGEDGFFYYTDTSIFWIFSAATLIAKTAFQINVSGVWSSAAAWIPQDYQSTGWVLIYLSELTTASGSWGSAGLGDIGVTSSTTVCLTFSSLEKAKLAVLTGDISGAAATVTGAMRNGCWGGSTFVMLNPNYLGIWTNAEKLNGAEYTNTLGGFYISQGFECYGNDGYTTGEHAGTAYLVGGNF